MRAGDVLRPAIETVVAVPSVVSAILKVITEAVAKRIEDAAAKAESAARRCEEEGRRLQRTWDAAQAAFEAQYRAETARADAENAKARREAMETIHAGFAEVVAVDRRARYLRAFGLAAPALALVFALGMLTEHWRGAASETTAAAEQLDSLRRSAAMASIALQAERDKLAQAATDIQTTIREAGTGLQFLRVLGTLPEAERAALNGIVEELAASRRGNGPSPQIEVLRQTLSLTADQRQHAILFARLGSPQLRNTLLGIASQAVRNGENRWWGEVTPAGCVANGPTINLVDPTNNRPTGQQVVTCLVHLPDGLGGGADTGLRKYYGTP
jgi:hypothetical protein